MLKILIISASDYLPLYVARSLNPKNYQIYCLGPKNLAIKWSRHCQGFFGHSLESLIRADQELVTSLAKICLKNKIDYIVPLDIPASLSISKIKKLIKTPIFPIASVSVINLLANKWSFAHLLKKLKLSHPRTQLLATKADLNALKLLFPFYVKPTSLGGGQGVVRISNTQELKNYRLKPSIYKIFPLLIQQEILGSEIDISLVARDGKIVASTIQRWLDPGKLLFEFNPNVFEIAKKIVAATNYSGLMHIDLILEVKTQKLFILECNPRTWGTINASIYAGTDFIKLGLRPPGKILAMPKPDRLETYQTTSNVLRSLLKNPQTLKTMSKITKLDLARIITDPLPYLLLARKSLVAKFL